ncbi:winged helix-turn-helix domain-containing protein [Streptomyces chartreusis]|uniref:winged helix-turn-helix domain-containing protein n=1 Tax=Streptomyces chartreusis TaxID=1969 RepID=UPI0036690AC2
MRKLLIRNGFSCQVPVRRAVERDEEQTTGWVKETSPQVETSRLRSVRWILFKDESGFSRTPPVARTWARRGRTPVIRVRGRSCRRISIATLAFYKPGERSRLIYRPRRDDSRHDGRKSFPCTDHRDLLIAARTQLGGPIVLVWDNIGASSTSISPTGCGSSSPGRSG